MRSKFTHFAHFVKLHPLRTLCAAALFALALHWREGGVIPLMFALIILTA